MSDPLPSPTAARSRPPPPKDRQQPSTGTDDGAMAKRAAKPSAIPTEMSAAATGRSSSKKRDDSGGSASNFGDEDEVSSDVDLTARRATPRTRKGEQGKGESAGSPQEGDGSEDAEESQIVIDPTKDLWANITLNVKENNQEVAEVSLLAVGGCSSGKTSLLQRIYSAGDHGKGGGGGAGGKKVRPTTALDYSFARRSDRNFSQVAHFWELGQNRQLSSLADIILSPDNIHAVVCAVVVDFFSTEGFSADAAGGAGGGGGGDNFFNVLSAWDTAVYWLKKIDSRSAEVLEKMKAKNSSTPAKLLSRAHKFCGGSNNPDLKRMRLSGLPTVLVVNKMDVFFKNIYNNNALRHSKDSFTMLVRAFRFLAHLYGCHLIFTAAAPEAGAALSTAGGGKPGAGGGDKGSAPTAVYYAEGVSKWRNVMSHLLFQTPFESKYVNFDLEKDKGAVLVTAEKDSFVDIGDPSSATGAAPLSYKAKASNGGGGEDGQYGTAGDAELERWRAALETDFPAPEGAQAQGGQGSNAAGGQEFTKLLYDTYAEPAVDALRHQKEEELEQYRKTARLKAKEAK